MIIMKRYLKNMTFKIEYATFKCVQILYEYKFYNNLLKAIIYIFMISYSSNINAQR